jgi:diaminopimelate epimerase
MEKIPFFKMSGSGNDFIIIDNRASRMEHAKTPKFIRAVCERKISLGADGLIFIEDSDKCDFSWRFFNSDGSEAEMCGNGGRCAARFAFLSGIAGSNMSFETIAGVIKADVEGSNVKIQLPIPEKQIKEVELDMCNKSLLIHSLNTGVPHAVLFIEDIDKVDVRDLGAKIRFHPHFQPAGTNVNFVSQDKENVLSIRTYERGVEDETFACGTGAVASALIAVSMGKAVAPVKVLTTGGEVLKVFTNSTVFPFNEVCLEGGAKVVCNGEIWEEAWK